MMGMKKLDDHVRRIGREAGSTYLIFPLIKFKIWRNLMYCSSCSLFSSSRTAILGSQPNSLIMRKIPIAVDGVCQRPHNTDLSQRPHFRWQPAHAHPSNREVNPDVEMLIRQYTYPLHGFLLYFLDFSCNGARDWEEGDHHTHPDECAPAKNVIQEPDAHHNLQRKI